MSERLFPTQEIGSLARPRWQLLGQRGAPLDAPAREEFRRWNDRLGFLPPGDAAATSFLEPNGSSVAADTVRDWGSLFGLRYLEKVGLDLVYDGEARRVEMYEAAVRHMTGFTFEGHVRSFDQKYYRKAAATGAIGLHEPYHLEEYRFLAPRAHQPLKLPVTGPYTIADWSFNEYYLGRQKGWKGPAARREAQGEFVEAVAREALRPTLQALVAAGCTRIQIDEPAAGTHPAESALVAAGFNAATEGIDAEFSMHICFSDYRSLFPALLEAKRCRQWALEFANRENDHYDPYAELSLLNEYGDHRSVGLGVLDVHRDVVETPVQVRDRILRAAKAIGDPSRIWANPDCGLRTRSLDTAWAKLTSLVEGARRARESLSGSSG